MTKERGLGGFSLVELMVVVAILGILVTIAMPRFQGMACRAKEAAVAQCAKAVRDDYLVHYIPGDADPYKEFGFAGSSQSCRDKLAARCIFDVNGDRSMDSTDTAQITIVVNALASGSSNLESRIRAKYVYDQNGDGVISGMDVLTIIDKLSDPDSMKKY